MLPVSVQSTQFDGSAALGVYAASGLSRSTRLNDTHGECGDGLLMCYDARDLVKLTGSAVMGTTPRKLWCVHVHRSISFRMKLTAYAVIGAIQ